VGSAGATRHTAAAEASMSRGSRRRTTGGRRHTQPEPPTPVPDAPRLALPCLRPVRRTPGGSLLLPTLAAAVLGRGPVVGLPRSPGVILLLTTVEFERRVHRLETAPGLTPAERRELCSDLQSQVRPCPCRGRLITLHPALLDLLEAGHLEARTQRGQTLVMLASRRTMRTHGAMRRNWIGQPRRVWPPHRP